MVRRSITKGWEARNLHGSELEIEEASLLSYVEI